ncbi:Rhodanese-like protein [Wallemia mellicola CBS 633.66]|uniref:Rhodanese-like protein n=2 Tax=Wallemia mellicola TaxID=1708541 RepID=A0A4T0T3F8_9BASI|nr:Rhodanese-like protein [Wallemia mellicola CBS 633.66]TIB68057.1 hypothetical protein E3Q24_03803 [Wallemia mellicola]EIM19417.1 Rhodanese-like protein [Wallemia mellicola CBS 633.66]TIB71119.1 hypothetical protein E3Q23_03904 [Wallemia mellicola]TIB80207.1 Rhodanese-like protein [Wallemia mellicola]TIB83672.1 Rhodanese-like protein [Wallemia mellicola]|eukprot:XP_006960567.1 Rhodanese-like protein [Wallemia mellicola CBS 633.66]
MTRILKPRQLSELKNFIALDASWHMPNSDRNPEQEYLQKHLPKARRWNLDKIAAPHPNAFVGHMLPTPEIFAQACSNFGIERNSQILLYDTIGVFSAPRAAFTFRAMGHPHVAVLDGGLPAYEREGLPLESGEVAVEPTEYPVPTLQENYIKDHIDILNTIKGDNKATILDARPKPRFTGEAPEPRPGLSSGHMPGAFSLAFPQLLTQQGQFKSADEIKAVFENTLGRDQLESILAGRQNVITSCGSGMTAAIVGLALEIIGGHSAIYDESWTGYAQRGNSPIVKD